MLSHVQLFASPWTVALQAPLSVGFSRQEYWSGYSFLQRIFPTQDQTWVSCIADGLFTIWATKAYYIALYSYSTWAVWYCQRDRFVEQKRKPRNIARQICSIDFWQRCRSISMEERKPFQQMMLEPWSSVSKNPKPNILVKIHSELIMNLKM